MLVSIQAIDPFLFKLMSEICSSDACDGVSLPYCSSLSDPFSRDKVIWYLMWQFHPRKWWQHSLVIVWKPTGTNVCYILKNNNEFYVGFISLVPRGRKNGGDSYMPCFVMALKNQVCKWLNVYVQYWYLIPHDWLILNHQLQVACIHDSWTICVPLPANMHHTSQRG